MPGDRSMPPDSPLVEFVEACGAVGPLGLDVEDTRTGDVVRHSFAQPSAILGRGDERTDLRLDHDALSLRHVWLQVLTGRVFFLDLRSRTGVYGAHGLSPSGWLSHGQAIRIGPFVVRVVAGVPQAPLVGTEEWNPLKGWPRVWDAVPRLTLEGLTGSPPTYLAWRMDRAIVLVGRAPECKLRIPQGGVSRFSCSLIGTPAGVWVVDLLSRGGVAVNGRQVRWSRLKEGDDLQIGSVTLRPHFSASSDAIDTKAVLSPPPVSKDGAMVPSGFQLPRGSAGNGGRDLLPFGELSEHEPAARMVAALAHQFAHMQQQMFDQVIQAVLSMGQMFAGLHREQSTLIREELARLHKVTEELRALQAELANHQPAAPAAAQPVALPSPAAGRSQRPPLPPHLPQGRRERVGGRTTGLQFPVRSPCRRMVLRSRFLPTFMPSCLTGSRPFSASGRAAGRNFSTS
jgi:pSer/pThr/pTyr-binding forkhead associated (FHA) protein